MTAEVRSIEEYLKNLDRDFWDISKQCRHRSDAAERGVLSGSAPFALATWSEGLNETVFTPRSAPCSKPTIRDSRPISAVSALICKEGNFGDFLFAFRHTRPQMEQIITGTAKGLRYSLTELLDTYINLQKRTVGLCRITKTCLYNFDPLKPHFYIVKLGFKGVYIVFLISAQ